MNSESDTERRARIIDEQEARERDQGVKAERLKAVRAQERAKNRTVATYLPGAERAMLSKPVIPR